jgi:transposase
VGKLRTVAIDPQNLPDDPAQLKQLIAGLVAELRKSRDAHAQTSALLQELLRAKRERSSEKLSADQLALFAAAWPVHGPEEKPEEASPDGDVDGAKAPAAPGTPKRRGGRPPLAKELPREIRTHEVAGKDEPCGECRQALRPMPPDVSERLHYTPAQLKVIQDVCCKYACACQIHTATKPGQPLPKSNADATLLAYVIVAKYAYHLPLHRQEQIWAALGVDLPRQTTGGWVAQVALLLGPLYQQLKQHVFESRVLGHDDTGVKVLDPKLDFARIGHLWPHCGDAAHPGVVFHYTQTRGGKDMKEFLADYRGEYLQVDAYSAYDGLFTKERGLKEAACWAHARRYLFKALDTAQELMKLPLLLIHELYEVEEQARDQLPAERLALRQSRSKPILASLQKHLQRIRGEALPKSPAAKAFGYIFNQWDALNRFCDDPDIPIDNNRTERALRAVAIGRRNWTFFGSDAGGHTAAVLLSFIGTCRLIGVEPYAWFSDVLARIGQGFPVNRLVELLPHRWQLVSA